MTSASLKAGVRVGPRAESLVRGAWS